MKLFEAIYILSQSDVSVEKTTEAVKSLIHSVKSCPVISDSVYACAYLDENKQIKIDTTGQAKDDECIYSLATSKKINYISKYSWNQVFFWANEIIYEHYLGPDLGYDRMKYYGNFNDVIKHISVIESSDYFLDANSFFFMPAYRNSNGSIVFQVMVIEDEFSMMCGRMTVR